MSDYPIQTLRIDTIVADEDVQARVGIDHMCVERYCEDHRNGAKFAPMCVVSDGKTNWLWDGFHRLDMCVTVGLKSFPCEIRPGTKRDAILLAAGANANHGLQRTRADKERSVLQILNDPEWRSKSIDWIAYQAQVGVAFADRVRREYLDELEKPTPRLFKDPVSPATRPTEPPEAQQPPPDPEDEIDGPQLYDAYKRPVPKSLNRVFGHKRELELILKDYYALEKRVKQAATHPSQAAQCISLSACLLGLTSFEKSWSNGIPTVVCPDCGGRDTGTLRECNTCGNRRFLSKEEVVKLPLKWRRKIEAWLEAKEDAS